MERYGRPIIKGETMGETKIVAGETVTGKVGETVTGKVGEIVTGGEIGGVVREYTREELEQFWAGYMEGVGSIQVNYRQEGGLRYRLIIKIKDTVANEKMLQKFQKELGGIVRKEKTKTGDQILWTVEEKSTVEEIIKIFEKYPPITTNTIKKLEFMKECMKRNKLAKGNSKEIQNLASWYLENRDNRHGGEEKLIAEKNRKFIVPEHFELWVAGYTEADGNFRIRENGKHVYETGLRSYYILEAIREKLGLDKNELEKKKHRGVDQNVEKWKLGTANKEKIKKVIEYFKKNPLLGQRLKEFNNFEAIVKKEEKG